MLGEKVEQGEDGTTPCPQPGQDGEMCVTTALICVTTIDLEAAAQLCHWRGPRHNVLVWWHNWEGGRTHVTQAWHLNEEIKHSYTGTIYSNTPSARPRRGKLHIWSPTENKDWWPAACRYFPGHRHCSLSLSLYIYIYIYYIQDSIFCFQISLDIVHLANYFRHHYVCLCIF